MRAAKKPCSGNYSCQVAGCACPAKRPAQSRGYLPVCACCRPRFTADEITLLTGWGTRSEELLRLTRGVFALGTRGMLALDDIKRELLRVAPKGLPEVST